MDLDEAEEGGHNAGVGGDVKITQKEVPSAVFGSAKEVRLTHLFVAAGTTISPIQAPSGAGICPDECVPGKDAQFHNVLKAR